MNILIGLLIIAISNFGQSSSYVPISRVKGWPWESFWLIQGAFAWLVFPLSGALPAIPAGNNLIKLWGTDGVLSAIIYGVLWGVDGPMFGLNMHYLGVVLGQSIVLGTCAGFGTLFPVSFAGKDLLHGGGLMLLTGVCTTSAGTAVTGYAGSLCPKNMSEEEKKAAVKDFALTKGLLVVLLAGVMSTCFALGLDTGTSIKDAALAGGIAPLYVGLPAIFLVTLGGFSTNTVHCIQQNVKNKTGKKYLSVRGNTLINSPLFCVPAGVLWYSQLFGLEMGKSFSGGSPTLLVFSWSILMSLNVTSSNVWGILLREWEGCGSRIIGALLLGSVILVISIIVVATARA